MSIVPAVLVCLAFAIAQILLGGTRLLFSIPVYGILGVAAVTASIFWRRAKVAPSTSALIAALLFAVFVAVRALASPVDYLARPDLFSIGGVLIVYLLTACHFREANRRLGILAFLVVLALLQCFVAAIQFTRGDDYMLLEWHGTVFDFVRSSDYEGRGSGLYMCPNHLAGYLEVVGVLALAIALWGRLPTWVKLLAGYCALVCYAGLLLTCSRGGFLGATAALVMLAVLSLIRVYSTTREAFGRMLTASVVLAALLAAGLIFAERHSSMLEFRAGRLFHAWDRPLLWRAALLEFGESPWAGTGSGTYLYYGRRFRDPRIQRDPVHAHNDYVELLGEYGIAGAALMLFFLAAHLRAGWRSFSAFLLSEGRYSAGLFTSNAAALNIGALSAVAAYAVHSAVDFNLHIPVNALLMAFVFGVLANPGKSAPWAAAGSPALYWPFLAARFALLSAGILLMAAGLPLLRGEYFAERARVALRDKNYLSAIRLARVGLQYEQKNPDLFYYIGESRFLLSQVTSNSDASLSFAAAAVESFSQGRRLFPQDSRVLIRMGMALAVLGRFPEAEEAFRDAMYWDPNLGQVHACYAFCLQREGRLGDAEAAYALGLQLSSDPQIAFSLGELQAQEAKKAN